MTPSDLSCSMNMVSGVVFSVEGRIFCLAEQYSECFSVCGMFFSVEGRFSLCCGWISAAVLD
jgi:hypothetical protein